MPGDAARNGTIVNSTDYIDVKAKVNQTTASSNYTPYYDVLGAGAINSTSYLDVKNRVNQSQTPSSTAPGPQDAGVGGLTTSGDDADLTGAMLAVQEGTTTSTGMLPAPAVSNQTSAGGATSSSGSGTGSAGGSDSSAPFLVERQPRHRTPTSPTRQSPISIWPICTSSRLLKCCSFTGLGWFLAVGHGTRSLAFALPVNPLVEVSQAAKNDIRVNSSACQRC